MQRGQAVIEFVFLILIVVVYLVSTTIPMVSETQNIISDTENVTRANNECQKLVNSIKEINLFGDNSRQTIDVFVPDKTIIFCNSLSDTISFETQLTQEPYPDECQNGKCTKTFQTTALLNCNISAIKGPQKINITLNKIGGEISFLRSE